VSSAADLALSAEDVLQVADEITGAFLAAPSTTDSSPAGSPAEVVSFVHVHGAFDGTVVCSTSRRFAAFCAEQMLAVAAAAVDDESIVDAIGEIANMVGGSVKALLPEPSGLSLPVVTLGGGQTVTLPGSTRLTSVDLRCAGEPFQVAVFAKRG
jgi:chemotaxis protein CheX